MQATSKAGFDLPYRKAAVAPGEAVHFLVEAGSTWDFAVDVKTHPWMEKICLHRGLDGSDSFLSSDHGGSRNRRQDRCVNQQYPKSKTEVQKTTRAHEATASETSAKLRAIFRRQSSVKISEFSHSGNEPRLGHTFAFVSGNRYGRQMGFSPSPSLYPFLPLRIMRISIGPNP
jgi:hypothetical protein